LATPALLPRTGAPALKKSLVEDRLAIDVRHWSRNGLLRPGLAFSVAWSRGGIAFAQLNVSTVVDAVQLRLVWCSPGGSELLGSKARAAQLEHLPLDAAPAARRPCLVRVPRDRTERRARRPPLRATRGISQRRPTIEDIREFANFFA
jgi:hypothetical protein